MDDRAIVARQLGRPPRAFHRVVARCPYGLPAVTEQRPYAEDALLADSLGRATQEQRRLRHELAGSERGADDGASLDSGIGGSRSPEQLKCLHAHVAFALARPGYALGDSILEEVPEPWPAARCCSEPLVGDD